MDTKSLQLTSRFSFPPNHFGYCGLDSASIAFSKCITSGDCESVPGEIPHFKGLYPYLKTIAEVTGLDYLDYKVIEAYWLGGDLLSQFKPEHYAILIKHLKAQNLPDFFIDEVAKNQPKVFIPLHLFNVIHIGVGKITGSVETNIDNINHCMIRWGTVTKIDRENHTITISLNSLKQVGKQFAISNTPTTISYNPNFLSPKIGDTIAAHWKSAVKILTAKEQNNLSHWTNQLISGLA